MAIVRDGQEEGKGFHLMIKKSGLSYRQFVFVLFLFFCCFLFFNSEGSVR